MTTLQRQNTSNTEPEDVDATHEANEQTTIPKTKRTPLPVVSLFIVFLIQFAEPVTATVIYPFINKFVRDTGVTGGDERKTGYFAGVIESLFFLAEAATVFQWGRASDQLGRKPILLLGPLGLCFAMLSFGLSNKFWMLVVSRCLQGIFNGNIGVSKTVMAEVTDSTNIADAYALIPVMWSVGSTIGPIIGGVLSEPASRWPNPFARMALFIQHPYFLPCAVAALIAFISVPIAIVGLRETSPTAILREKKKKLEAATVSKSFPNATTSLITDTVNYGTSAIAACEESAESGLMLPGSPDAPCPSQRVLSPRILLVYGFISFTDMCAAVLQPLVWSTSISLGGLGFDPYRIGMIMGIWGFINAIFQMTFLGAIVRKIGPRNMLLVAFTCWITLFALYPLLSFSVQISGAVDARVWTILLVQLTCLMTTYGAYAGIQVIIVDNTPRESLGAANGLAQAVASGLRGVAPSIALSLLSISLERRLLGGNFVFYLLMLVGLIGLRVVSLLPPPPKSRSH